MGTSSKVIEEIQIVSDKVFVSWDGKFIEAGAES